MQPDSVASRRLGREDARGHIEREPLALLGCVEQGERSRPVRAQRWEPMQAAALLRLEGQAKSRRDPERRIVWPRSLPHTGDDTESPAYVGRMVCSTDPSRTLCASTSKGFHGLVDAKGISDPIEESCGQKPEYSHRIHHARKQEFTFRGFHGVQDFRCRLILVLNR